MFTVWNGVVFVRQGLYQDGVFRFSIEFAASFPDSDCPVNLLLVEIIDVVLQLLTSNNCFVYGATTCMENLEMSGILTAISELSQILLYWPPIGSRRWAFQRTHYWTPKWWNQTRLGCTRLQQQVLLHVTENILSVKSGITTLSAAKFGHVWEFFLELCAFIAKCCVTINISSTICFLGSMVT